MKFVINADVCPEVSLTLEQAGTYNKGMIHLKVNGKTIMGFKNGKYRLYSDAAKTTGIVFENEFIVQDQTI